MDIHKAFYNSYNVIVRKIDYLDLFEDGVLYLIHDPDEPLNKEICDNMNKYFEEQEEYEICNELINIFAS